MPNRERKKRRLGKDESKFINTVKYNCNDFDKIEEAKI
jgi:hypothetical protein